VIDSIAAKHSDHVVAVSNQLALHLIHQVGVPARKVSVIVNGVETENAVANPVLLREELGIAANAIVIASVGRLEPIKGYDVAVRALAQIQRSDVVLMIAGDGSERRRLMALAADLGISDRVFLPGWRNDIDNIHAAADMFTMCSHSEGTSVSLLEAMAAGLCPVVTDVGGNAAVLGPELQHRLVRGNDSTLARAWCAVLDDPARTIRDGGTARERVQSHFSLQRMVKEYEKLYDLRKTPLTRNRGH
jgi:glycosyltransferase involved in cell wall biosynthesis